MSDRHLRRERHDVRGRKDAWWYEEPWGISVIVEPNERTTIVKIQWRYIRQALARKDRK